MPWDSTTRPTSPQCSESATECRPRNMQRKSITIILSKITDNHEKNIYSRPDHGGNDMRYIR